MSEKFKISEQEIKAKTSVGLTREQAIEVIEAQRVHDAELEAAELKKKPKSEKGSESATTSTEPKPGKGDKPAAGK